MVVDCSCSTLSQKKKNRTRYQYCVHLPQPLQTSSSSPSSSERSTFCRGNNTGVRWPWNYTILTCLGARPVKRLIKKTKPYIIKFICVTALDPKSPQTFPFLEPLTKVTDHFFLSKNFNVDPRGFMTAESVFVFYMLTIILENILLLYYIIILCIHAIIRLSSQWCGTGCEATTACVW